MLDPLYKLVTCRLVSLPYSKIIDIVSCIFENLYIPVNNTIVCLIGVPEQLPIAFHAEMTAGKRVRIVRNQVIKFQNVVLDTRQSFQRNSSIFVVPVTGVYVLHWTISVTVKSRAGVQLMVNVYLFLIKVLYVCIQNQSKRLNAFFQKRCSFFGAQQ